METATFRIWRGNADGGEFKEYSTEITDGMMNETRLSAMKPTAYLINTARGGLVDEAALAELLKDGRIGHAALDVYGTEPLPADSPFRGLDNVTLTPHAAWVSPEAATRLLRMGIERLRDAIDELP